MKTALILGSTGLTGSILLNQLLENPNYKSIITIVRKAQNIHHPKLIEIVSNFDATIDLAQVETIDSIFSCLGTTRKQTPNLTEYRFIEIDIPARYIEACLKKGLKDFHFISAIGASNKSVGFYNKIKFEAQEKFISYPIPHIHIYQPAMLIGPRKDKRIAEKILAKMSLLIDKTLNQKSLKYHSMDVSKLAEGMQRIDLMTTETHINYYTYPEIVA